ncbi:MAG: D-glucuronyl C5-epimerase family protein, partial [Candidatus Hydrothermarchaeales archaeon]
FITSVVWIGEYSDFTVNKKAKALFEEGIKTIAHFLPEYNMGGGWSYYDAVGHRSSKHYHRLHVDQLALLYNLTGDEVFKTYADLWGGEEG